jgi:Txe/YoeB family toxin of Txe-Axe toxin-antitoxin module
MPCYDPRDDEDKVRNAQLVKEYRQKIDNLTEMLCEMCSKAKFENLPQNIRGWYSRHLDNDRKRVYTTFVDKFSEFEAKVKDMSGEELREIEKVLDSIK